MNVLPLSNQPSSKGLACSHWSPGNLRVPHFWWIDLPDSVFRPSLESYCKEDSWGHEESDTTEQLHFHFHALEKEMATHSSVLARRIPGTEEPGGLLSMGSHRVGHDWSYLAAAAAEPYWGYWYFSWKSWFQLVLYPAWHFTWCTLHIS